MSGVEKQTLASSRVVALHRLAEGERVIVFCHPAPGAANFDPDPSQTVQRNVTLLACDRPGYGGSDPVSENQWPTVYGAADDIAEVLTRLCVKSAGVVGWSAGGRVALALAARYPELIDRVVVAGTPAPDEEVPWIPPDHRAQLDALRGSTPEAARKALMQQFAGIVPSDPGSSAALELVGRSPADDAALEVPGASERLAEMLSSAFAQQATGMVIDIQSYCLQPWGFEPEEVKAKTLLLYGSKDPLGGSKHAGWWKSRLPSARVEMVPGAGHLALIPMWKRILSHLAPGAISK